MFKINQSIEIPLSEEAKEKMTTSYYGVTMRQNTINHVCDHPEQFAEGTLERLYVELASFQYKYDEDCNWLTKNVILKELPELASIKRYDWEVKFFDNMIKIKIIEL